MASNSRCQSTSYGKLVGNHVPQSCIQDAIKFPDVSHWVMDELCEAFPLAQPALDFAFCAIERDFNLAPASARDVRAGR